jgi:hypothetical protein
MYFRNQIYLIENKQKNYMSPVPSFLSELKNNQGLKMQLKKALRQALRFYENPASNRAHRSHESRGFRSFIEANLLCRVH